MDKRTYRMYVEFTDLDTGSGWYGEFCETRLKGTTLTNALSSLRLKEGSINSIDSAMKIFKTFEYMELEDFDMYESEVITLEFKNRVNKVCQDTKLFYSDSTSVKQALELFASTKFDSLENGIDFISKHLGLDLLEVYPYKKTVKKLVIPSVYNRGDFTICDRILPWGLGGYSLLNYEDYTVPYNGKIKDDEHNKQLISDYCKELNIEIKEYVENFL